MHVKDYRSYLEFLTLIYDKAKIEKIMFEGVGPKKEEAEEGELEKRSGFFPT